MKLSQNLKMDIVQTKPKPTLNLLYISQNKSDLAEPFSEPSDEFCLKPDQIKLYQTNTKSSLKQPKQVIS